ncbi:MAG: helix-turn-helix domain-containing protein, partial [Steroidobacteraceae bacterium]
MMPGLNPENQKLSEQTPVKPATGDQRLSPNLSNHTDDPPPERRTAAPVASRDGGAKSNTKQVDTEDYPAISLLNKWHLLQAISADPNLSAAGKVVAFALLDCLNSKTGRCFPSVDYLARRIGRQRRVISPAISQLVQHRWLSYKRRRGSSAYRFAFDRLLHDDVQETAPHESEDVREAACLEAQDSAHVNLRKTAHLETGNLETENG